MLSAALCLTWMLITNKLLVRLSDGLSILFVPCCTPFRLQNLQEDSEDSTDNRSVQENKVTEDNKKNTVEKEPHK